MVRTSLLFSIVLISALSASAQNKDVYTFIDPVVKTWTVDRKVHVGKKLFASLEMNGNLRVYELQGRKPLFLSIQSELEIGEAGNSSTSKNMLQFSPDGKWLGVFTIRNGFRLYDTDTWQVILELSWKGVTPSTISETPFPYDIWFMGKHLVLFFEHDEPVNNGFVFDLQKGGIVNVTGNKGFGIYDIYSVTRYEDSTGIELQYNTEPKEVDISWNGKPIRTLGRKTKGQFLEITGTDVILHPFEPEAEEVEDSAGEEEKKEELQPVSPLELMFTDSVKRRELQSLLLSYDFKDFFWKQDLSIDSNRAYIESTRFQLLSTDTINGCSVTRYDIYPHAPAQLIEIAEPGEYPRYFLHSWGGKWLRYGNAVFLHSPPEKYNPTGRWRIVLFDRNEFRWDIFDRENHHLPNMIVSSPNGKEIAFAVNEYGNATIYGFSLDSSKIKKILTLRNREVVEDWLRDGGFAPYPQLSIYRFLENGYFFFQGKDIGHNNMLFETRFWSKVHELPVAGASRGIRSSGFRNIIRTGETFLLGSVNSWDYRTNNFNYMPIPQDSLGENDFIEPSPGIMHELNNVFLKKVRLAYDSARQVIQLGDGQEYISISRDGSKRMIWTLHSGDLELEYYPEYTWLDAGGDLLNNGDPNYFEDKALSRNVRFTTARGKKIMLVSPYGPSNGYIKGAFSHDRKYVFTLAGHHYMDVWKAEDGEYLGTVIPDGTENFIIIDKDQHFYTRDVSSLKNLFINFRGRIYPAAEMMQFQNRPDLILGAMDFIENPQLLSFYRNWALNRENRLGDLDLVNKKRPVVAIETGELPLATSHSMVKIPFLVKGASQRIAIAWLNNIKSDSLVITGEGRYEFNLKLQTGTNKIQIASQNVDGLQSLRETIFINYEPGSDNTFRGQAVVAGVSMYSNPRYNLQYAVKDANDLYNSLKWQLDSNIVTLVDEKLTEKSLDSAALAFRSLTADDIAIVYLAGHGALDDKGQFYFCTSETDLEHPASKGISMEKLQSIFARNGARKRLLILDACHSGNAAASQMDLKNSSEPDTLKLAKRGLNAIRTRTSTTVSEKNYAEIVKQQLTDVNDETGVIVFSATSGGGAAFESERWGNGIFTSILIRALSSDDADVNNDKKLQIQELIDFVIRGVIEATNGQQKPESSIITWDRDWILKETY